MKWSILILTQPSRASFLKRLLDCLEPQVAACEGAEIRFRTFDNSMKLGANRQAMIDEAEGEYISFVDDDDCVSTQYVRKIYPLLDGVDYIGFQVQTFINGNPLAPTYHSLKYGGWSSNDLGFYRDLSHLNPIRRELSSRVKFTGHGNEDVLWADEIRGLGIVKTEHYISEVMYYYFSRANKNDSDKPGMYGPNS